MVNILRANADVNDMLGQFMRSGGSGLSKVPRLIKQVIREETWRRFETKLGHVVEHEDFETFVTAEPLSGLGGSMDMLRHLCRDDSEALDLLDQVTQRPHGGDRHSEDFKSHNVTLEPSDRNQRGTSRSGALRRLRKDAPELHAEVLAGNLSAHGAMIQAGFRRPTMTVPVEPAAAARALRKRFTDDQWAELVATIEAERGTHDR